MIAFDYTSRIAPSALKAAGCSVAIRYVMPQTSYWTKTLRNAEAAELLAAGIPIVSNYESTADRMKGGGGAGRADAVDLLANWRALGAPGGLIGWFSADWDVQAGDVASVLGYLNAAAGPLGGKRYVGLYGGYRACRAAADNGFATWQTVAWSGGHWDSRAAIRQTGEQRSVGGVQVDVNDIVNPGALGAWAPGGTVHVPAPPTPTGTDVNLTDMLGPVSTGMVNLAPDVGPEGMGLGAEFSVAAALEGTAVRQAETLFLVKRILAAVGSPPPVDVAAIANQVTAAIVQHLATGVDIQAVAVAVQAQLAQALGGHGVG